MYLPDPQCNSEGMLYSYLLRLPVIKSRCSGRWRDYIPDTDWRGLYQSTCSRYCPETAILFPISNIFRSKIEIFTTQKQARVTNNHPPTVRARTGVKNVYRWCHRTNFFLRLGHRINILDGSRRCLIIHYIRAVRLYCGIIVSRIQIDSRDRPVDLGQRRNFFLFQL